MVEGDNENRDLNRVGCLLLKTSNLAGLVKYPLQHGQFVWLDRIEHMNVRNKHSFTPSIPMPKCNSNGRQLLPDDEAVAPQATVMPPGAWDLSVASCWARTAVIASVPCCHRPPNAQKP
ncbi:hypothetical protein F4V89_25215 [Neorhizobium galegae]|nr:hypothetical protein F4V89_25215 [Neorhizobium galegae]